MGGAGWKLHKISDTTATQPSEYVALSHTATKFGPGLSDMSMTTTICAPRRNPNQGKKRNSTVGAGNKIKGDGSLSNIE